MKKRQLDYSLWSIALSMFAIGASVALLCSCSPVKSPPKPTDAPTDVVYHKHYGWDDEVPVQFFRLRSGAAFIIIGTDTHGTPIVYTQNADKWKRQP